MDPSVGLRTLVVGILKDQSSSNVWRAGSPKLMKFGLLVPTALRVKFNRQRKYMLALESWNSSRPINLLKVGLVSPFLSEFPSMEVLNGWAFLIST